MTQKAAIKLMDDFAKRTGLRSAEEPKRYLWTDAFAVINLLELHRRTGDERYQALVRDLVNQVHWVLGRHRADAPGSGWLSGLPEEEGAAHPTVGGLRIGKPLPDRAPQDPLDEQLEWERDGQYFHYLTRWMDALSRGGAILHETDYQRWAAELAHSVLPRFLRTSAAGAPVGLAWKMSTDLSRVQLSGMSLHDALDGYVTFRWLDHSCRSTPSLRQDIAILERLVEGQRWGTADPLGLGGLLLDAFRLALLLDRSNSDERMIGRILEGVSRGLDVLARGKLIEHPAAQRLAFRELGLAIGLQAAKTMASIFENSPSLTAHAGPHIAALDNAAPVGAEIVEFWSESRNRQNATWLDHQDINEVMLATALLRAQVGTAVL